MRDPQDVPVSTGEPVTLEEATAKIYHLRQELKQATQLLEYYRQFQPDLTPTSTAPTCYFVHQMSNDKWGAGRVIDGRLDLLNQGLETEQQAVDACWTHYREEGLS